MRTHACLYLRLPIAQAMATRLEQNRSIVLDLSSSITTVLASVVPQAAVETSRCPNCVATSITSQLLTRVSSCAKRAILRTSRALQSASRLNRQTSRILPLAMMRESRHKDFLWGNFLLHLRWNRHQKTSIRTFTRSKRQLSSLRCLMRRKKLALLRNTFKQIFHSTT